MKTTTRTAPETTVIVTSPGKAIVTIGRDSYLFVDEVSTVRVSKIGVTGEYTVRVGTKGCYGCGCKGKQYGTPRCRHEKASDLFLTEVF